MRVSQVHKSVLNLICGIITSLNSFEPNISPLKALQQKWGWRSVSKNPLALKDFGGEWREQLYLFAGDGFIPQGKSHYEYTVQATAFFWHPSVT